MHLTVDLLEPPDCGDVNVKWVCVRVRVKEAGSCSRKEAAARDDDRSQIQRKPRGSKSRPTLSCIQPVLLERLLGASAGLGWAGVGVVARKANILCNIHSVLDT